MVLRQPFIPGLFSLFLSALIVLFLVVGCGSEDAATASAPSVDSTDTRSHTLNSLIENNRQLYKLQQAMNAVDIQYRLRDEGPFTLFAPSNRALERDIPNLDELIAQSHDTLRVIIEHHLVRGAVTAREPGDSLEMSNLRGSPLTLALMPNEELRINNQQIRLHQNGKNGVLYMIDTVLRPRPAIESDTQEAREETEMPDPDEADIELEAPQEAPAPDEPLPDLPPDN